VNTLLVPSIAACWQADVNARRAERAADKRFNALCRGLYPKYVRVDELEKALALAQADLDEAKTACEQASDQSVAAYFAREASAACFVAHDAPALAAVTPIAV
jgi:hypothetical protein